MCIDCARRKLRTLGGHRQRGATWYLCIIDHDDHVHIRIDGMHTPEEWVQVSCTYDDLQRALQELDITYHFHVHQTAQDGGCSEEIVSALQQETVTKEAAEELSQDTCAVCYDIFQEGDTIAVLPCAHRYHAGCIAPWLRKATTCPGCRAEITRESVGLPAPPRAEPIVETPILRHAMLEEAARESTQEGDAGAAIPRVSPPRRRRGGRESPPRRRGEGGSPPRRRGGIRRLESWVASCRLRASEMRACLNLRGRRDEMTQAEGPLEVAQSS